MPSSIDLSISIGQRVMCGKTEQAAGKFKRFTYSIWLCAGWSIVEGEDATVRHIFAEFNAGNLLSAIAKGLNLDGITTRNGAAWQHQQVKHIVRNEPYAACASGTELRQQRSSLQLLRGSNVVLQSSANRNTATRKGTPTLRRSGRTWEGRQFIIGAKLRAML